MHPFLIFPGEDTPLSNLQSCRLCKEIAAAIACFSFPSFCFFFFVFYIKKLGRSGSEPPVCSSYLAVPIPRQPAGFGSRTALTRQNRRVIGRFIPVPHGPVPGYGTGGDGSGRVPVHTRPVMISRSTSLPECPRSKNRACSCRNHVTQESFISAYFHHGGHKEELGT